ncbi:hypothetical protein FA15DRAFT_675361 [Coprinopsis marcescibilis]|uniref:MICOS complex subunit n=1 Tax=Coprinopsis marcescibilis TaxID=230819 RepID=A0A5C3KEJ3_COPMA|nr:hypothetical protein FA15DRAFT_675361 [Coprinopsis marcescibilis]
MYRVASRMPKRAMLAAAVGAVTLVESPREKLSIYPAAEPQVLLAESPSPLALHISVYRKHLQNTYAGGHAYVQGWVSKWIGVEQAFENRVKSIISPTENLTPGLLYVGVSTLTGSILARNRIILTRILLPPIFLLVSANHFLPQTTTNLSNYLGSVEERYFPAFAHKHEIAKAHSAMAWERAREAYRDAREKVGERAVKGLDKVQDVTGLKIKETLGLGEGVVAQVKEEAQSVLEKKVEEVKPAEPAAVVPAPPAKAGEEKRLV